MPTKSQPTPPDAGKGRWVTLPNGVHVFIDHAGKVIDGPAELKGKHRNELNKTPEAPQVTPSVPEMKESHDAEIEYDEATKKELEILQRYLDQAKAGKYDKKRFKSQ